MADFLDTPGLSNAINDIIKTAQKKLFIISPYLRFSQLIFERLNHAGQKGVEVSIIFGKSELHQAEESKLRSLNVNLYFKDNLHAKCYANEQQALITSMNLHQYSEAHNEEMGILITSRSDSKAYASCLEQIDFIRTGAKVIRSSTMQSEGKSTPGYEFDPKAVNAIWKTDMVARHCNIRFEHIDEYIIGKNGMMKDVHISTQYGFFTVDLPISKEYGRSLKQSSENELNSLLKGYSWYWSSPFDRICLYRGSVKNNSLQEEIEYQRKGEQVLTEWVKGIMRRRP